MATLRNMENVKRQSNNYTTHHASLLPWGELNSRDEFDLQQLKEGIKTRQSLPQALLVWKDAEEDTIRIVDGERRWRAIGELIEEGFLPADFPIPVEVVKAAPGEKDVTRKEALILCTIANEGKSFTPLEKACHYQKMKAEGMSVNEIAEVTGFTVQHVYEILALSEGSDNIKAAVESGQIGSKQAANIVKRVKRGADEAEELEKEVAKRDKAKARQKAPKKPQTADAPQAPEVKKAVKSWDEIYDLLESALGDWHECEKHEEDTAKAECQTLYEGMIRAYADVLEVNVDYTKMVITD